MNPSISFFFLNGWWLLWQFKPPILQQTVSYIFSLIKLTEWCCSWPISRTFFANSDTKMNACLIDSQFHYVQESIIRIHYRTTNQRGCPTLFSLNWKRLRNSMKFRTNDTTCLALSLMKFTDRQTKDEKNTLLKTRRKTFSSLNWRMKSGSNPEHCSLYREAGSQQK